MSKTQLSLSPDLTKLREAGYNIKIQDAYLLVRDIPYLNASRVVRRGILVSKLDTAGDIIMRPEKHIIDFIGERPHHADGKPMDETLICEANTKKLDDGIEINFSFSRMPRRGHYLDHFEKVDTYAAFLLREASQVERDVTPLTHAVYEPEPEDQNYPFNYLDTASSRAEINLVSKKLANEIIGIVGIGGTGSYVLDLTAKTPAKEIHLFDGDVFLTHNAFRSPGAPSLEELRKQPLKTAYFGSLYSKMHRHIMVHESGIDASNVDQLRPMTFVFLCMDSGPTKKLIVEKLEEWGIPFIDVGMGLYRVEDSVSGKVRATTSLPGRRDSARENIPFSDGGPQAEYDTNIQIADLNALNACLAVIRWKKLRGFYLDSDREQFTMYTVGQNLWTIEDTQ
jgi:hypothetical protein